MTTSIQNNKALKSVVRSIKDPGKGFFAGGGRGRARARGRGRGAGGTVT